MNFSLRTLLIFTAAVAVACASLIYASPVVGDLFYTLGLLTIPLAGLAARYRQGPSRAFWIGFVVLFTGYFCHAVWPIGLRTAWWVFVNHEFSFRTPGLFTGRWLSSGFQALHGALPSGRFSRGSVPDELAERYLAFVTIGHTVLAAALGICGGLLARRLAFNSTSALVESNQRDTT